MKPWHGNWCPTDKVWKIDWQLPWYAPWAGYGASVAQAWQHTPEQLHTALNSALSPQAAKQFVPQHMLPDGVAYEAFIHANQRIPTRNNAHDFFNGLCWLRFPQSKAQLNRLQAIEIARDGVGGQRGRLRDALTVFDENAALLWAPLPIWQALQDKQWQDLFVTHRGLWSECQLQLFGHALLEKMLSPYKGITAHVWCMPLPDGHTDEQIDACLCQQLTPDNLSGKPFAPLPLAGIPGWWPHNHVPDFYEDKKVFRD